MSIMPPRKKITAKIEKTVACRQEWKCGICFKPLPATFQIDHIIPHAISQNDDITNLMALCPNCHAEKTSDEQGRIIEYKKIAGLNKPCWFCLRTDDHVCDRVKVNLGSVYKMALECIEKYSYILNPTIESMLGSMNLSNPDTLIVMLYENRICCLNHTTYITGYSADEILTAITSATRSKMCFKRYKKVIFKIFIENVKQGIDDFLHEEVALKMPDRLFKDADIDFVYELKPEKTDF